MKVSELSPANQRHPAQTLQEGLVKRTGREEKGFGWQCQGSSSIWGPQLPEVMQVLWPSTLSNISYSVLCRFPIIFSFLLKIFLFIDPALSGVSVVHFHLSERVCLQSGLRV